MHAALHTGSSILSAPCLAWRTPSSSRYQGPRDSLERKSCSRRRGGSRTCQALSGNIDTRVEDKRRSLLRFVQDVQPHDVLDHFQQTAPPPVADAMRTTVTNLLGALPPTYFSVTVSAKVEDLAQLMFSMLMTGYMYRNAQYRIDLDYIRRSYDDVEGATFSGEEQIQVEPKPVYAEGTQLTRVNGSILRWRKDTETLEEMDAREYIQECEGEIAMLRELLSRSMYARGSGNEVLDFIKVQEPQQLKELTENVSGGVMEAMNTFVQRLLGGEIRRTESNATELARMFYFLMVVGYNLRQLEVKCDFESSFTVPSLSSGVIE